AEVVDDPDRHGDRCAEQQPAVLMTGVEERERRHDQAEEEREPAEARHRQLVHAPAPRNVDDSEPPRHPSDCRWQQYHDGEADERAPEDAEMIGKLVEDAEVRAACREHAVSVLRRWDAPAYRADTSDHD